MADPILSAKAVTRRYRGPDGGVTPLTGVDLDIQPGELCVLRGRSGAGKTTLLLSLGGLARPSSGQVLLSGEDLYARSPAKRRALVRRDIGFMFQSMHLVPYLSAAENVRVGGGEDSLARLGLADRATHRPEELSAGERSRVALARALAGQRRILLADEPTGHLDPESAAQVTQAISEFHRAGGTVLVVTHATDLDLNWDRELCLEDGCVR